MWRTFTKIRIPFKGNGNSVVHAYRLELRLYKNSMITYFKSNYYKKWVCNLFLFTSDTGNSSWILPDENVHKTLL